MQWWAYESRRLRIDERLLAAIPNAGGYVGGFGANIRRAAGMKREGVRAGYPDYGLFVPRGAHHGLFLELKTPSGALRPAQRQVMELLEAQGYRTTTAYGLEPAITSIKAYLMGAPVGKVARA